MMYLVHVIDLLGYGCLQSFKLPYVSFIFQAKKIISELNGRQPQYSLGMTFKHD